MSDAESVSSADDEGTGTDAASATAGTTAERVLGVEDLHVTYGEVMALRGVDLHVDEGEIVGLIGPNGAGKTTLANTVSGFLDYEGSVTYRGEDVHEKKPSDLVSAGLVHCSEDRDLFGHLSVADNLELGAYRHDEGWEERRDFVYDLFPRLEERSDQHARTMSGGEQQMLAIGRALMSDPDLLVLDEPTLGLAPVILQDISDGIEEIRESGVTILLTEQNVTFTMNHADRVYLLEQGRVEREGHPDELRGDEYIRDAYLGH
ncbi:ABC transporter ATP-binding protein [Halospeciosus flavus]|uniref:ABC transporter ATP-binding protein n=1 Tax=Halospeciosus flavus TaxID=3032283 RepID=A0ABD5Z0L4_9EURY|nr:ABC transporter ATP-binding protein [Halospeciosus flavus]